MATSNAERLVPAIIMTQETHKMTPEFQADVIVIGGGVGGCAAALSALRSGFTVVMTEETAWVGGQLTSQAVPPDENLWIEEFPPDGCVR